MLKKNIVLFLVLLAGLAVRAQVVTDPEDRRVVQITGIVAETDSSAGVPFVNVRIKGTARGTVSDYYGFFSIVARESDTLVFSCVGYSPAVAFLPDHLESDNYYLLAKMGKDTIHLKTVGIRPYNAKNFGEAFVNLELKDDDYDRAMKNLSQQELDAIKQGMPMDGGLNYKNAMQQRSYALYNAGGLPSPSILNPFAWAKFFKALKEGKFKDPYKDNKK